MTLRTQITMAVSPETRDDELVARLARGCTQSLEVLYRRHGEMVTKRAHRVVGDPDEVADVVHDAFLHMWERVRRFEGERGTFGGWMTVLVRNLALDRVRSRRRRHRILREQVAHEPRPRPRPVDGALMNALEGAEVRAALEELPAVQRDTLRRAFFDGLTYEQIATLDGVPVGTIKSRANRGLSSLRERLSRSATV